MRSIIDKILEVAITSNFPNVAELWITVRKRWKFEGKDFEKNDT